MPDRRRPDEPTVPLTVGLLLLPVLCCGLPVLVAAGVFGVVVSWLFTPWGIALAVLAVAAVVGWFRYRTATRGVRCRRGSPAGRPRDE